MTTTVGLAAPPRAGAMIEALRGLGYSTEAALADVIDNSIAAGAKEVRIEFVWQGPNSRISISDDGEGMTGDELFGAMRLGARSPLEERAPSDLGRFGMGLKTASFSQCRRLTVESWQRDKSRCLRWDLDVLEAGDGDSWLMLEGAAEGSAEFLPRVSVEKSGTTVLWEEMDRVVGSISEQDFLDLIDRVEGHLSMVYHRLLEDRATRIVINGRAIRPWDPFMSGNLATWNSPTVTMSGGRYQVQAQGHVLPHKDKLDAKEYDSGAGPHGWTAQQGFYVYRNKRLLVAGSWLGLGLGRQWRKEEQFRLARLRLDIPNSADADWRIDIRKSMARPPALMRQRLVDLAEDVRARARATFVSRGSPAGTKGQAEVLQVWKAVHKKDGVRYQIDETHPAIRNVLDAGANLEAVRAMIRVIEETVPVQRIWLDTSEARETPRLGFHSEKDENIRPILQTIFQNMVLRKGYSAPAARAQLLRTEPFQNYPDLVAELETTPPLTE